MKRLYESVIEEHFKQNRQMVFLVGPRQVGKTTSSLAVASKEKKHFYFNWDIWADRLLIMKGAEALAEAIGLNKMSRSRPILVLDELHKYRKWKNFIKGFFDKYGSRVKIIITGSSRLDIYKVGGDSLMGRYFPYHLHPLSVAEIISSKNRKVEIAPIARKISKADFDVLFRFGGFPEPFIKRSSSFSTRWAKLRSQQLFSEDLRDLTKIQEIGEMQILAELLISQAGQLTSYTTLANHVHVSIDTVRRWLQTLKAFYYCFTIQPWTKNVTRSLLKEPKIYLWDWSLVEDHGARVENFVASHLYKAVQFWTDVGLGDYKLHFLRDKEKREVDFLVVKNKQPWFLVEVKSSDNAGISKSLFHYQNLTQAPYAFQVVFDMEYQAGNCFSSNKPIIVPAKSFLSQLV